MKPRAREPGGYRVLARRLARDLDRVIEGGKYGHTPAEYDRRVAQGLRTLQRFRDYETTHKRLP